MKLNLDDNAKLGAYNDAWVRAQWEGKLISPSEFFHPARNEPRTINSYYHYSKVELIKTSPFNF